MSYSLARKVFLCNTCVPPREIKMLVGGDQMTVVCQECWATAGIKPPKQDPLEEEKVSLQPTMIKKNSTIKINPRNIAMASR